MDKMNLNFEIISNLINSSIQIFVSYAGQVLGATLILIIGFYFAGKLSKIARKNLSRIKKIDPLIVPIIGNIIRYGIIIITIIALKRRRGQLSALIRFGCWQTVLHRVPILQFSSFFWNCQRGDLLTGSELLYSTPKNKNESIGCIPGARYVRVNDSRPCVRPRCLALFFSLVYS